MNICTRIASEIGVKESQTKAAIMLIDEGNTVPFIARYRKEATGGLNDEQLRMLEERLTYLRNLEEKKAQVIKSIEEQDLLTDELKEKIENATTQVAVDDLYRPYRPKRRTRAMIAKERGLEPLAQLILMQGTTSPLGEWAKDYINEEKGVLTIEDALSGASDIIAELISDNPDYRAAIRDMTIRLGKLSSTAKDKDAKSGYENYYEYEEPISRVASHRVLAVNRGEAEKVLAVKIVAPEERILEYLARHEIRRHNINTEKFMLNAIADSYKRLIEPSIATEVRNALTDRAEESAIAVFKVNLRQLLMQPPISGRVVLGWDPAFRTGCKLAVADETGKILETAVIFPTAPTSPEKQAAAKRTLTMLIKKHNVSVISLGNGTASRESEQFIAEFIRESGLKVEYVIVSEAGASVYSAGKLAAEEFPSFDVGQRSAASIARRLTDPLSELVKIDPRSIGVGQYQHDMDQKRLGEALGGVVEDCVNKVGVDLNTASAALLRYIAGVTPTVAKNIVAYREKNGRFLNRKELLKVNNLGEKAFTQCAGFMRISGGNNFLDSTAVHPESYDAALKFMQMANIQPSEIGRIDENKLKMDMPSCAAKLGVGIPTLLDIIDELRRPSRDPRSDMPAPVLRSDTREISDLKEGMILKGTVRNVIDFGLFVDIGVHQDGLVHVSQIAKDRFIKHPLDAVKVGEIVEVKVLSVDVEKRRISLTMII